eukprot:scaffold21094_cov110-Isochrysis_galbana.AAC.4
MSGLTLVRYQAAISSAKTSGCEDQHELLRASLRHGTLAQLNTGAIVRCHTLATGEAVWHLSSAAQLSWVRCRRADRTACSVDGLASDGARAGAICMDGRTLHCPVSLVCASLRLSWSCAPSGPVLVWPCRNVPMGGKLQSGRSLQCGGEDGG